MASDLRLATRGGGGRSNWPERGVSPGTGKAGVSTSKHLGDIGENGWDHGLEGTWKHGKGDERRRECPAVGSTGERRRC